MPYKLWTSPVSISSVILMLSVFILRNELFVSWKKIRRIEKILLLSLALTLWTSFALNFRMESLPGMIAYAFSILAFMFLRLSFDESKFEILRKFFVVYLIVSGILITAEIVFGPTLYLSNYLIADNAKTVGFRYGSGFAPYASLAGGLIAWPLIALVSEYVLRAMNPSNHSHKSFPYLVATAAGTIALFFSLARATWVGLYVALIILAFISLRRSRRLLRLLSICTIVVTVFATGALLLPKSLYYSIATYERIQMTVNSVEKILNLPTTFSDAPSSGGPVDASVNTRVYLYGYASSLISLNPFWGIGVDRYPKLYQHYFESLGSEVKKNLDPTNKLDIHNFVLTYIVENGIVASIPFFLLIALYLFRGFKAGANSIAFPLSVSLVSICFWMLFTGFIKERIFWIAIATVAACSSPVTLDRNKVLK